MAEVRGSVGGTLVFFFVCLLDLYGDAGGRAEPLGFVLAFLMATPADGRGGRQVGFFI
jgi:hypothetical protein